MSDNWDSGNKSMADDPFEETLFGPGDEVETGRNLIVNLISPKTR